MKKIYYEPAYVSKFVCDGSACKATCCKDWQIEIDFKAANRYRDIDSNIADFKNGHYFINFNKKNSCPFLTDNSLCGLQLEHGEKFLSGTCRTFPRRTYFIDDFCERTLSLACPLAAQLALTEPVKFIMNETDDETDVYNSNVPDYMLEYLVEIQMTAIHIIQEKRLTIDQRLIILGYFLDKLDELIGNDELESIDKVSAVYKSESFFNEKIPLLLKSVEFDEELYKHTLTELFDKAEMEVAPSNERNAENDSVIENYLVNEFFGNIYPYRTNGTIIQNYGLFVLMYKFLEALLGNYEPIEIITWFSRNIDHDVEFYHWLQTKAGLDVWKIMKLLHSH